MPLQTFNPIGATQTDDWSNLANLFGNYYKGYEMGQTPQRLEQEQQKRRLENQYLESQNKYLGEQSKYFGPSAQSQIDLNKIHGNYYGAQAGLADQQRREAEYWNNILNQAYGNETSQQQPGQQSMPPQEMPPQQGGQGGDFGQTTQGPQEGGAPGMPQQQAQNNSLVDIFKNNPAVRARAAEKFPHSGRELIKDEATGDQYIHDLLTGEKTLIHKGMSEQAREFKKGDVKFYDTVIEGINNTQELGTTLNEIGSLIDKYPQIFNDVTGPINSTVKKYLGSNEQKYVLGKLDALSGSILLNTAKSLKGSFRQGEQDLIENIKASTPNTAAGFVGKYEATKLAYDAMQKRLELTAKYVRDEELTPHQAMKRASEETDLEVLRPQIETALGRNYMSKDSKVITLQNKEGETIYIPSNMNDKIKEAESEGYKRK